VTSTCYPQIPFPSPLRGIGSQADSLALLPSHVSTSSSTLIAILLKTPTLVNMGRSALLKCISCNRLDTNISVELQLVRPLRQMRFPRQLCNCSLFRHIIYLHTFSWRPMHRLANFSKCSIAFMLQRR
jgi:hypothetical protein